MTKINLNKREIDKINEILSKDLFEGVSSFELIKTDQTAIGSCLYMKFPFIIDDVAGSYEIEITGTKDW